MGETRPTDTKTDSGSNKAENMHARTQRKKVRSTDFQTKAFCTDFDSKHTGRKIHHEQADNLQCRLSKPTRQDSIDRGKDCVQAQELEWEPSLRLLAVELRPKTPSQQ